MGLAGLLRWILLIPRILVRADGFGNRLRAAHCLARSVAAHVGLRLPPRTFRLVLDGNVYEVDAARRDLTPYPAVWIEKEYEPDERFVPGPDGVVVDIGAQVGFLSTYAARAAPEGRILAIEPDPTSFRKLVAGIRANGLDNVKPIQCAISDREGMIEFVSAARSVDSRLLPGSQVGRRLASEPGAVTSPVRCTTLDHLLRQENVNAVDLLKIDVEGAELAILQSAVETLPRVRAVVVEVHDPRSIGPIDTIMRRAGLSPVSDRRHVHAYLRDSGFSG